MQNKDLLKIIKPGDRVVLMLSGGKDSALCLKKLLEIGVNVYPIHFTHRWGWTLSTQEARKLAKRFDVELKEIDISKKFIMKFNGFLEGRPCRKCKPIMYETTIKYALKNSIKWICVGDNSFDTINIRIGEFVEKSGGTNFVNRFLDCINEGVAIPDTINIIRPILDQSPDEISKELAKDGIIVLKNHETGDKYEQYWREGCPMQYNEAGTLLTEQRMDDLFDFNQLAVDMGKKGNYRVSIHLPSKRIVTIPVGYEAEVEKEIIKKYKDRYERY